VSLDLVHDLSKRVVLIAEYYRILIELPNTTYKVPNTNILLKLKLIFGFRRVKYIYWVNKKLLFGDVGYNQAIYDLSD